MFVARCVVLGLLVSGASFGAEIDSDRDGVSDRLEQVLLEKFLPRFHISAADCDVAPAEFFEGAAEPKVKARNGTVYGQVFPVRRDDATGAFIEVHYYLLWGADCGLTAHPLDTESVTGLLRADEKQGWRAEFWYAAAHEGTLCDMGSAARAEALGAMENGPVVWVSRGKHASYLSRDLCTRGCGGDVCDGAAPMRVAGLINLGEPGAPMNGAVWTASAAWPLASKMTPRYTAAFLARMPAGDRAELVSTRNFVLGSRGTARVAGRTYASLRAADASTQKGLDAASSATRKSLRAAFRSVAARLAAPARQ